jgi:hypothetical protein
MAYKVFSNGDALTGGELNTFLMNQSVISFATITARDAALTAPLEGQLVWLEDSNKYVYYTGSAWADLIVPFTPVGTGNAIINGAFEINQRNLTTTTTSGWTGFDRWNNSYVQASGTVTYSSQTFTPGAAPVAGYESRNFVRFVTTGQSAAGDYAAIRQPIEDVRTFAGQSVTLSFWAKSASATPNIGITLEQNFGSGGSASVKTNATVSITSSWARYSATVSMPSVSGKTIGTNNYVDLYIFGSVGTTISGAGYPAVGIQNNTFDIWGVQLESGTSATPFRRNANSIQGELAACQRYYVRFGGSTLNEFIGWGAPFNSTNCVFSRTLPVEMRVLPTSIEFSTLAANDTSVGPVITSLTLSDNAGRQVIRVLGTVASGLTQFRYTTLVSSNSLNAFLGVSAEL